ncbi:MAG: DHH family phosphoesterase [Candidatus Aenigmatarchaeota archaeon]
MREKIERLIEMAKKAAEVIKTAKKIRIISHYDADGISAAAIIAKALLKEDKPFHITFLKQLRTEDIERLKAEQNDIVMFLDMGAGLLDALSKFENVIVCDHHQPQGEAKNILHINPVLTDIIEDVSGSGVAYLIARAISSKNQELAELAVIGAIGDSQMGSVGPEWGLFGLNREILKDAENAGMIKIKKGLRLWGRITRPLYKALAYSVDPFIPGITGSESGALQFLQEIGIEIKKGEQWTTLDNLSIEEQRKLADEIIKERIRGGQTNPEWIFGDVYELVKRQQKDANEFATLINACGKMGKAWLGLSLCINNPVDEDIYAIIEAYRKEIGKALDWITKNKPFKETDKAVYLLAGDAISEHVISNITSILSRSYFEKPIFSFVKTEDGNIKISARASNGNLKEVVSLAAKAIGGEGGGHAKAAGAIIPSGTENVFIENVEKLLILNSQKQNLDKVEYARGKEKVERKGLVHYLSI